MILYRRFVTLKCRDGRFQSVQIVARQASVAQAILETLIFLFEAGLSFGQDVFGGFAVFWALKAASRVAVASSSLRFSAVSRLVIKAFDC